MLFTFTSDVSVLPTRSTGWAFPHATLELWLVSPHTSFEMFVGVQTAAKHASGNWVNKVWKKGDKVQVEEKKRSATVLKRRVKQWKKGKV